MGVPQRPLLFRPSTAVSNVKMVCLLNKNLPQKVLKMYHSPCIRRRGKSEKRPHLLQLSGCNSESTELCFSPCLPLLEGGEHTGLCSPPQVRTHLSSDRTGGTVRTTRAGWAPGRWRYMEGCLRGLHSQVLEEDPREKNTHLGICRGQVTAAKCLSYDPQLQNQNTVLSRSPS